MLLNVCTISIVLEEIFVQKQISRITEIWNSTGFFLPQQSWQHFLHLEVMWWIGFFVF